MTPREVVKSILNLPDSFLDNIRKESNPVVKRLLTRTTRTILYNRELLIDVRWIRQKVGK